MTPPTCCRWRARETWQPSRRATPTARHAGLPSPALVAAQTADERRLLLIALGKPLADEAKRTALLDRFCSGLTVWTADDWDTHGWREAARRPDVAAAIARAARLAAPDFAAGAHVPREAGEQLPSLPWPADRTDFLAFPMLGFCHATAAVAFALASAVRPTEEWLVLVSQQHATVLSLSDGTLVDFASAAVGEQLVTQADGRELPAKAVEAGYVEACGVASVRQMVLNTTQWAVYPALEPYLDAVGASSPLSRPMPAWAGCDRATFGRLVASGTMDDAFDRGRRMQSVTFPPPAR